jgi:hypothetical protein
VRRLAASGVNLRVAPAEGRCLSLASHPGVVVEDSRPRRRAASLL